jgi:Na+-transporting methylmalonyl-CoA/oxaloacetate decarboxylase gamma subunit
MMGSLNIGIQLTVFGMGLVFLLLAVMALLITLLLRFDRTVPDISEPSVAEYPTGLDAEVLAAISIAVTTHRALLRKEAAPAMRQYQPGTIPSRWVNVGRTLQNTRWHPGRRVQ